MVGETRRRGEEGRGGQVGGEEAGKRLKAARRRPREVKVMREKIKNKKDEAKHQSGALLLHV